MTAEPMHDGGVVRGKPLLISEGDCRLTDSLRAIALAAVSEPGRADREVARQACEDRDELAPRRKRNEESDAPEAGF